jgi:hypothetical protein
MGGEASPRRDKKQRIARKEAWSFNHLRLQAESQHGDWFSTRREREEWACDGSGVPDATWAGSELAL